MHNFNPPPLNKANENVLPCSESPVSTGTANTQYNTEDNTKSTVKTFIISYYFVQQMFRMYLTDQQKGLYKRN